MSQTILNYTITVWYNGFVLNNPFYQRLFVYLEGFVETISFYILIEGYKDYVKEKS